MLFLFVAADGRLAIIKHYFLHAPQIQLLPFADYFPARAHNQIKEHTAMKAAGIIPRSQHRHPRPAILPARSAMAHFGCAGSDAQAPPPVEAPLYPSTPAATHCI